MTPLKFKSIYQKKGWTQKELAKRWGFVSGRRIRQIQSNPSKNPYYIDAVNGLPFYSKN